MLSLSYQDTDSFFLISIKDELANLTDDCEELLEKRVQHPLETQSHNDAIEKYLNQLRELRRYSEQIETALHEYEENIMKIEEEISNNTLCN
jgi:chromosome segregation ATPase